MLKLQKLTNKKFRKNAFSLQSKKTSFFSFSFYSFLTKKWRKNRKDLDHYNFFRVKKKFLQTKAWLVKFFSVIMSMRLKIRWNSPNVLRWSWDYCEKSPKWNNVLLSIKFIQWYRVIKSLDYLSGLAQVKTEWVVRGEGERVREREQRIKQSEGWSIGQKCKWRGS